MRTRLYVRTVRRAAFAAVLVVASVGIISTAGAQTCNPQCAQGQVCVQGTCMVPAPQQYAPPSAAAPPPNYYPPQPQGSAYPPPQGSAYPPPQGGAYPPPQGNIYSPPQGGSYPPPQGGMYPPPPPTVPSRRGLLILPFLGINSYQQGENSVLRGSDVGVGFRLGVLLGGRVADMFSVNGEITIDAINPKNVPAGHDISAFDVVLAFSPLVHVPAGNIEIVAGPKLGFWVLSADDTSGGLTDNFSANGYVLGLNAGIFGAVSNSMSVGGLLSFDIRTPQKECQTPAGFGESCATSNLDNANKVLGITGALLF